MTMIFTFILINSLGDPEYRPNVKRAKRLCMEIERATDVVASDSFTDVLPSSH